MTMRVILAFVLTVVAVTGGEAQISSQVQLSGEKNLFIKYPKNHWLVGAGVTIVGLTAKTGKFMTNQWWIGAEAEIHNFLTTRQEVGLFTRYYTGKRRANGFVGTGLSYGHFQGKKMKFDEPAEALLTNHRSLKMSLLAGLDVRLTKRVSIEGVAKIGQLTKFNWTQPSLQGSINVYLGK